MSFLFVGGIALALLFPVILVLGILVILALRHDDDPDANRAPAIYASVIAFLAILTILFAATGVVSELMETTSGHTHTSTSFGYEPQTMPYRGGVQGELPGRLMHRYSSDDDGAALTEAVAFLIVGLAAAGLLALHRRLFARRHTVVGAASRVHRAYLLVMCFVLVIVGVAAASAAVFELYETIFSGAANIDNRADELRQLIPTAFVAVGAWWLWMQHWGELGLDLGGPPPAQVTATDVP
jgi:hypothetical protein